MLSALAFGSADNTYHNLDYSGYHKNLHPITVWYCFMVVYVGCLGWVIFLLCGVHFSRVDDGNLTAHSLKFLRCLVQYAVVQSDNQHVQGSYH